jgi:hypothetical protein
MTKSEDLTTNDEAVLDRWSGTRRLASSEVETIVANGRAAAATAKVAGYPDVPHLEAVIAAFPAEYRDAFSVTRFLENATIDHPTLDCEVGVREYLESGTDNIEPVLALARAADQWGM